MQYTNTAAFSTSTGSTFYGSNFSFRVGRRPDDGLAGALAVLGVPPGSPPDVIRKAYRGKLMETHPDVGGSEEAVRRVIEAYRKVM